MNEAVFKQLLNKDDKKGKAPIFLFYYYYDGNEFRYFTKGKCELKHGTTVHELNLGPIYSHVPFN